MRKYLYISFYCKLFILSLILYSFYLFHRRIKNSIYSRTFTTSKNATPNRSSIPIVSLEAYKYKCTINSTEAVISDDFNWNDLDLLNVPCFIQKYNQKITAGKSYFGTTSSFSGLCSVNDSNANMCVPKYGPWLINHFALAPKVKTVACRIQKSMSTILDTIICYLSDEVAFQSSFQSFSGNDRKCGDRIDAVSLEDIINSQNIGNTNRLFDEWNVFAVIRDPIDRLLSGFLDKCIVHPIYSDTKNEVDKMACHGCGANFTCFVINQYHRIMAQSRHPQYQVTNADIHFFPQAWRCEFKTFLRNISIVKYSNPQTGKYDADLFINGLMEVLNRSKNINPSSLKYISKQLRNSATIHVTSDTFARKFLYELILNNPFLMEFIVRMYYWDYVLFGYPFPQVQY